MRITSSQAASRPIYTDRNPIVRTQNYTATLAPHAFTQRWSYTVPAGKKAFCDFVRLYRRRTGVATTASDDGAEIDYTPSGGAAMAIIYNVNTDNTNMLVRTEGYSQFGFLGPGDNLQANTSDASTGGSVQFTIGAKIVEYDA